MASFAVIVTAAGESSRFQDKNYKKPFAPLDNRPVWLHSVERFVNRNDVKQVILVIAADDEEFFRQKFGANIAILGIDLVIGGKERSDSVKNGLARVSAEVEYVAVHDAARPCLVNEWIDRVFAAAQQHGAAILAVPVTSTLKRSDERGATIEETVDRRRLWEAQTPQVFRRQLLVDAYARHSQSPATDDAQLVERTGQRVTLVSGSSLNIKITTKEDLRLAEQALKALPRPRLTGPAHPFADDDLWR